MAAEREQARQRGGAVGDSRGCHEEPSCRLPITEFAHKAANGKFPLRAATGTAPDARAPPRAPGWPSARPTCCRSDTFTSCSPFPPNSPTSPCTTEARLCATCCSGRRQGTMLTIAADRRHLGRQRAEDHRRADRYRDGVGTAAHSARSSRGAIGSSAQFANAVTSDANAALQAFPSWLLRMQHECGGGRAAGRSANGGPKSHSSEAELRWYLLRRHAV